MDTLIEVEPHLARDEVMRQRDLLGFRGIYDADDDKLMSITALVRRFCKVPIAGISIVDRDQVLLKCRLGIEADRIPRTGAAP